MLITIAGNIVPAIEGVKIFNGISLHIFIGSPDANDKIVPATEGVKILN